MCPPSRTLLILTEPESVLVYPEKYLRQFGVIITPQEPCFPAILASFMKAGYGTTITTLAELPLITPPCTVLRFRKKSGISRWSVQTKQ